MSIDTFNDRTSDAIMLLTPIGLRDSLPDDRHRLALERHRVGVRTILSQIYVQPNRDCNLDVVELSKAAPSHPMKLLAHHAVKSVTLSHVLYEEELPEEVTTHSGYDWRIKTFSDTSQGTDMRFFVAKANVGSMNIGDGIEADLIERRTFAGMSVDQGETPRAIDISHLLGYKMRHERDARKVALAQTSLSFYAVKNESVA